MPNYLQRQILHLLEPIGFIWACLVIVALYHLSRRHWRLAAVQFSVGAVVFLFGTPSFPNWLIQKLEKPYTGVSVDALPSADAIVMLGGASQPSQYEVADMHLTQAADRVVMTMELARLGKAPVVVLGGAGGKLHGNFIAESELVRNWLVDRNLVSGEVIALQRCGDTHDEALQVRALAQQRGWNRVLLVTSAYHMRRAVSTFRTAGVDVIPVPCNFLTELSQAPAPVEFGVPRAEGFGKFGKWMHEQVGWWVYRKRGWVRQY